VAAGRPYLRPRLLAEPGAAVSWPPPALPRRRDPGDTSALAGLVGLVSARLTGAAVTDSDLIGDVPHRDVVRLLACWCTTMTRLVFPDNGAGLLRPRCRRGQRQLSREPGGTEGATPERIAASRRALSPPCGKLAS
jgi:hypothetical protein